MRRIASIVLIQLGILTSLPAGADQEPVCIPPVNHTSPARCTFNIWGYVTDGHSNSIEGAVVDDGAHGDFSNEDGFFDLYELQPGYYQLEVAYYAVPGCYFLIEVRVEAIAALMDGGVRRDFALPCAA